jgi:hypothetical protein
MVIAHSFIAEFTGGFDARAKGLGRLLTVTSDGETVRIIIRGENPVSNNLGFVILSDETFPWSMWESIFRGTLPKAEGFKVVSGVLF